MKVLKIIGGTLLFILIAAVVVVVSVIGGWLLRYLIWVICFLFEIVGKGGVVVDWISNHDTLIWIICSVAIWPMIISGALGGGSSSNTYTLGSDGNKLTCQSNSIEFVDAGGNWRHYGDDFIDCRGCWCKWGGEFVDNGGNWRKWGDDFVDGSGSWRRWGDDFVDGAGNWVRH